MSFFRRKPPAVPDDAEYREKMRKQVEERAAQVEAIQAEVLPVANKLAGYLEHNHFAEKIKSAYQLREGS